MELATELERILERIEEGTTTTTDAALLRGIIDVVITRIKEGYRQMDIAHGMLCDCPVVKGEKDALPESKGGSD